MAQWIKVGSESGALSSTPQKPRGRKRELIPTGCPLTTTPVHSVHAICFTQRKRMHYNFCKRKIFFFF